MLKLKTTLLLCLAITATALADPCGMVPPIYVGNNVPIARVGEQQTYVFYQDGIETFVIRPGFTGNVDEFGMLIPFPTPPEIRKVPDEIFGQIANAIDPPEVIVSLYPQQDQQSAADNSAGQGGGGLQYRRNEVRVLKKEAVGMYEVAVLAAGSSDALKKWMDEHGYKYPEGMDKPCEAYIQEKWCFVAVKTQVGAKGNADPKAGQRAVNPKLPTGSTFDGYVQGMGFRFHSKELVVPMRLSAFNKGELRNILYLLTDSPKRIRAIPEEYVVRQISGKQLIKHVTQPLPVRIYGGESVQDLPAWWKKNLVGQRNPEPKNGQAKELFASDLLAVSDKRLSLGFEEQEKDLLRIGERFGLRGPAIDRLHAEALAGQRKKVVDSALSKLEKMTLTVVDGDFPREVIARKNLTFSEFRMSARRNTSRSYDAKQRGPAPAQDGRIYIGHIDLSPRQTFDGSFWKVLATAGMITIGFFWIRKRRK